MKFNRRAYPEKIEDNAPGWLRRFYARTGAKEALGEGTLSNDDILLKLFDVIPFPMIFSTLQFNQILDEIDIIALASIQFGFHTRCLPIDLIRHSLRNTGNFRRRYFSTKIFE